MMDTREPIGAGTATSSISIPEHAHRDLRELLAQVLRKALTIGGERGTVVLIDSERNELVIIVKQDPVEVWPPPPEQPVRLKFRVGEGVAGRVAETGELHLARDVSKDPYFVQPTARPVGQWSLLSIPIISLREGKKRVVGAINLEGPDNQPNFFEEKISSYRSLADETSILLEEATWGTLIRSVMAYYRLRRIQAVSQALISQQTHAEILKEMTIIAFEELQADLLTLYTWNELDQDFDTPPIQLGQFSHPEAMRYQIHTGDVIEKVFHEWGSTFFPDIRNDEKFLDLGNVPSRDGQQSRERFPIREKIVSAAIMRLRVGKKYVGVLCVNWRKPNALDEDEQVVLEIFANQVAAAMENAHKMRLTVGKAVVAQRDRVHRDLHDWIAGDLTAVYGQLRAARNFLQDDRKDECVGSLTWAEERAISALKHIRTLLAELKPLSEQSLRDSLITLKDEQRINQCEVELNVEGEIDQLPFSVSDTIFRITREAATNAQKHGHATFIAIDLSLQGDKVRLVVSDNGIGGPIPNIEKLREQEKYGVAMMKQLSESLNGQLSIAENTQANGWSVNLEFPPFRL